MTDIGNRRLEALSIARYGRGPVKVMGQPEYVEVRMDNGLRYSILIRSGSGGRRYNLICPKNGRIIGPVCRSWRGVISDWKKRTR